MNILQFIILCTSLLPTRLVQQNDVISLSVYIRDSFTRESLRNARLVVMNKDSMAIDTAEVREVYTGGNVFFHTARGIERNDSYILKAECKGYVTAYSVVKVKRYEKRKTAKDILLQRLPVQLKEVTVTGSKVLMVHRGDTIVYNAEAFQLSNGSMLDALIRQLPGTELHGNRITVNGQFVNALLVNGRDFFKGDPAVALNNMPAYYVNTIKVYRQANKKYRTVLGDSAKNDKRLNQLIMDVELKRDYAEGWLGNGDVGYGTSDHFMARAFGMRYTNHSGLFIFGNINNTNNIQSAARDGDWEGNMAQEGRVATKTLGINFSGNHKATLLDYSTSLKVNFTDQDQEEVSSVDNYYSTRNVYMRSKSEGSRNVTNVFWQGSLFYPRQGVFSINFEPKFTYSRINSHNSLLSATFTKPPFESYKGSSIDSLFYAPNSSAAAKVIINQRNQRLHEVRETIEAGAKLESGIFLYGKLLDLTFEGRLNNESSRSQIIDHLIFNDNARSETQDKFIRIPNRDYNYRAGLKYPLFDIVNKSSTRYARVEAAYMFHRIYSSGERQLYRLDLYDNYTHRIDILPSTSDSLQRAIDIKNSYLSTISRFTHELKLNLRWVLSDNGELNIILPVYLNNERITDYRNGGHSMLRRNKFDFAPRIEYVENVSGKKDFSMGYGIKSQQPRINYLIDIRDDSDPLNIVLGNPCLGRSVTHDLSLYHNRTYDKKRQVITTRIGAEILQGAISMKRQYDLTTGINITKPENINGNWKVWGDFTFGRQLDKAEHFRLSTTSSGGYTHSVDYSSLLSEDDMASERSCVMQLRLGQSLKGDYRLNNWHVGVKANFDWLNINSKVASFATQNVFHYNYGVSITKSFASEIDFDTELMRYSRHGYSDPTMNDRSIIWNLFVTYSFGKLKQWMLKAEGHDILHQVSNVRQSLNAQGRTETWYKSVPSYWMLHLVYQFKKEPKKRKQ